MEQYMIGISEKEINKINPEVVSGIYILKGNKVNSSYGEMKGLNII